MFFHIEKEGIIFLVYTSLRKKVFSIRRARKVLSLIKRSRKEIFVKIKRQKRKIKEYIIDNMLVYGELLTMTDEGSSITFRVQYRKGRSPSNVALAFMTERKEVVYKKEADLLEQKEGYYIYAFQIPKQSLPQSAEKNQYYLYIGVSGRWHHIRFEEDYEEENSVSFFETNSHLFMERRDRHRRVFFRASYMHQLDTIFDLPHFVNSLSYQDGKLTVKGEIWKATFSSCFPDAEYFFVLKSKGGVMVKAPFFTRGTDFEAALEFSPDRFMPKGKWNFYIMVRWGGQEKYFPSYIRRKAEQVVSTSFFLPAFKETVALTTHIKNGKIFAKVSYLTILPKNITITHDHQNYQLSMEIYFQNIQMVEKFQQENACYLRFNSRDTNEYFDIQAQLIPQGNTYIFKASFPVNSFTEGYLNNARRWDLFLGLEQLGEIYNYRIRTQRFASFKESAIFLNDEIDRYYCMFYRTKYRNLSFVYSRVPLNKHVESYSFEKGVFSLKGHLKFKYHFDGQKNLDVIFQLVNRRTEETVSIKAVRRGSDFKVEIPYTSLIPIIEEFKEIIDFYVVLEGKSFFRKMKIGLKQFDYYKDEVFGSFTDNSTNGAIEYYMTITPKGNLKLESFFYQNESYELLKNADRINPQQNLWIVGERPNTAQDNGIRFFEYVRNNHPEIEIYYAIESGAPDAFKVEALGNVLYIGSSEHVEKSLKASTFIGTHDLDYILPFKGIHFKNYRNAKKIFLQHGVLGRKNVPYHKNYYKYPFDVVIVSSQAEKELVVRKMGYHPSEVGDTGLARFDKLQENHHPKREVLLIPTWREWITNEDRLLHSSYFQKYMSFITSEKLFGLLERYDLQLNFYPHYRMQEYIVENVEIKSDRIKLIKLGEKDVQELIKENSLMITDYSSVSFDFTYLKKPVIYYHFDRDLFFSSGILRPIEETFLGDIVATEEELIRKMEEAVKRDFTPLEEVSERIGLIFSNQDHHNNERIFQAITEGISSDITLEVSGMEEIM
ncbi:CDP-glycerol glycerophosphotransferase family protein [Bacillus massilinigeriensis]|uniref:CDP-glycerol glycerophosphotransferase family protein n=1 Tax=Bacillus mediterraneensis TaxID=1805474 RepID=UPI0008F911BD|nr:CDP-glycerol glycerophosphotransferase family protein [Bacillus mediterraneensis]